MFQCEKIYVKCSYQKCYILLYTVYHNNMTHENINAYDKITTTNSVLEIK